MTKQTKDPQYDALNRAIYIVYQQYGPDLIESAAACGTEPTWEELAEFVASACERYLERAAEEHGLQNSLDAIAELRKLDWDDQVELVTLVGRGTH